VPSKNVPEAVERITGRYVAERTDGESFQGFVARIGKAECKKTIEPLTAVPSHEQDASYYTDWHDAREFTTGDMGMGECAGEVVSPVEFELTAAEREAFEAQLHLEKGEAGVAAQTAYAAMLHAARALLEWKALPFPATADGVAAGFREHFYDTGLIFDPSQGGNFAHYFFRAHEQAGEAHTAETARRLIGEAQLFIEACHASRGRMLAEAARN